MDIEKKPSKAKIEEWKKQYGNVFRIEVDDKECYLKKPTRKALSYSMQAGKESPIKSNEILLNECWLAGDEEIKTDDSLFLSVSAKLGEIIAIREAELEKL
jgi:hypothetical protein